MCYFIPGVNMKNERITIRLSAELKEKLSENALKNGFPSATAYLVNLIGNGLSQSKTLDTQAENLHQIKEQVNTIASNQTTQEAKSAAELDKIFRFSYINYRIIIHILARLFYIKPGDISRQNKEDADAYIKQQVKLMEERFGATP